MKTTILQLSQHEYSMNAIAFKLKKNRKAAMEPFPASTTWQTGQNKVTTPTLSLSHMYNGATVKWS